MEIHPNARPPVLVDVVGLTKRYGSFKALDEVDLSIGHGEVHALLGQNGAGKSTLIKILAGVHHADAGTILSRGRDFTAWPGRLPIAFIHQDLGLVDTMSVAENISLVAGYRRRCGFIDWKASSRAAADCLAHIASVLDPAAKVSGLSAAERSLVAIARALAQQADVIVLDEPTAALHECDVTLLLQTLGALRARGIGMLYVTHRLDEIFRFADTATVLRDGRRVWNGAVKTTTPEELIYQIVGRKLNDIFSSISTPGERSILELEGIVAGRTGPVSLRLREGEILGLVGLRGAGQDDVGRAVAGITPIKSGTMRISDREFVPISPEDAVVAGVGFVSSRRFDESIAPNLSLRENLYPNGHAAGRSTLNIDTPQRERTRARAVLRRYDVRPTDPERPIVTLSGGNQQKVVLARWLESKRRILVLEEPTSGVDIGAKADIYHLLHEAARAGTAVLVISSDLPEVAGICHRALVFERGRISAAFEREGISVAKLTSAAAGAPEEEVAHVYDLR